MKAITTALLAAALCTSLHAEEALDHVARIGSYDYEISVDRSVWPYSVSAVITEESRIRQGQYKDPVRFVDDLKRHRLLVVNYMNSLRGTPSVELEPAPEIIEPVADRPIEGCPKVFEKSLRGTEHDIGKNKVSVGVYGYPGPSSVSWQVPVVPARIYEDCQARVGKMGGRNDDDGGHLIGAQLGGWGKRANLVPQNYNLNRGMWRQMQNEVANCTINGYTAYHNAWPIYDTSKPEDARPTHFQAVTQVQSIVPPWDTYDAITTPIPNKFVDEETRAELNKIVTGLKKFCKISCTNGADGSCKV